MNVTHKCTQHKQQHIDSHKKKNARTYTTSTYANAYTLVLDGCLSERKNREQAKITVLW